MPVFKIEHTARESTADLAVQAASILLLIGLLAYYTPPAQRLSALALLLAGLAAWTLIEYCVHRFVLHGLRPWSTWHAQHHRHPLDLIFAPTVLIAGLFALLVFAPIFWLGGMWIACGLTLGVLSGYFLYSLTHLAVHQQDPTRPERRRRRRVPDRECS